MLSTPVILALYCALIVLASLLGGLIPILVKLTHKRMELAISFVAGVMLGVGMLHMLPHAIMARAEALPANHDPHLFAHATVGPVMVWVIVGFLAMFLIARFFRFHHHDPPNGASTDHGDHHHHHHHGGPKHGMTWAGAAVGLSLHSLIEGVALASSVAVVAGALDGDHSIHGALAGLATFIVIVLHKPFDAMTIGTLMSIGGHRPAARHMVNLAFSLLVPVGVLLFYAGLGGAADRSLIASSALAFSAGTFLCISLSDLLPELQFHQHDRGKLSAALFLGLGVAWGIGELESRAHSHDHAHPHESHQHHEHHDDCDHEHDHEHEHVTSFELKMEFSLAVKERERCFWLL